MKREMEEEQRLWALIGKVLTWQQMYMYRDGDDYVDDEGRQIYTPEMLRRGQDMEGKQSAEGEAERGSDQDQQSLVNKYTQHQHIEENSRATSTSTTTTRVACTEQKAAFRSNQEPRATATCSTPSPSTGPGEEEFTTTSKRKRRRRRRQSGKAICDVVLFEPF